MRKYKGIFITFEGVEGSGKTTHIKSLCEFLISKKLPAVSTREPGGVKISEKIRDILLDCKNKNMSAVCELLLYQASRAQIISELILPQLKKGKIIVCDRFQDATYAYQGYGAGIDIEYIKKVAMYPGDFLIPDLTILMDLPVGKGLSRSVSKDRMDQKSRAFHSRVRNGYLQLAKKNPDRIKVVDVVDSFDVNQKKIREIVLDGIKRYKR